MKTARAIAATADLTGKTIFITGGSSGIGTETAIALAMTGADVIITARNLQAGAETLQQMQAAGRGRHQVMSLDLSQTDSVQAVAERLHQERDAIDIFIANAGVSDTPQDRLDNGLDVRFATNFLGHFILCHQLHDMLAEQGARLLMLGSAGHKNRPVHLEDPAWQKRTIDQRVAYGESKSALSLFAVEATRRWHGQNIFANCILPGSVLTGLMRHRSPEQMEQMLRVGGAGSAHNMWRTVEECAATSVWAAVAPELERIGGQILEDCALSQISGPDMHVWRGYELHATDSEAARLLWNKALDIARNIGVPLDSL